MHGKHTLILRNLNFFYLYVGSYQHVLQVVKELPHRRTQFSQNFNTGLQGWGVYCKKTIFHVTLNKIVNNHKIL